MRLVDADAEVERLKKDYCEECTRKGTYGIFGAACTPCWVMDAAEEFENAQTIEPEERRGQWINDELHGKYICTCCNKGTWRGFGVFDFCPNCGTRMDATDTNNGKGGAGDG